MADPERIARAADHIAREAAAGHEVVVVASAMAGETNRLVGLIGAFSGGGGQRLDRREADMALSTGEQVSCALLALALQQKGLNARSWAGWQLPIRTTGVHGAARISGIETRALDEALARGEIPVVAGFQGMAQDRRITTLGRGGSDTSAVAIAAAMTADRCDIYTDVDGVYTCDPRIVSKARKIAKIAYEEMLELASLGAKVLQTRSVELAMVHRVPLRVVPSFADPARPEEGTLVCDEVDLVEQLVVSGITYSRDDAKVTLVDVENSPSMAGHVFGTLSAADINVDMIVQSAAEEGRTDLTFTVPRGELETAVEAMKRIKPDLKFARVQIDPDVAKISVVGVGMRSHAGVADRMFRALGDKGIDIHTISTSEIKISVLIDAAYTELAVRALHSAYGLDAG